MDNEKDAEMVLAWMPQPEPYIKERYEEYKGNLSELRQQDGEDRTV